VTLIAADDSVASRGSNEKVKSADLLSTIHSVKNTDSKPPNS
jgi:hypothetical protein